MTEFESWSTKHLRELYHELNPARKGDRVLIRMLLDEIEFRGAEK